MSESQQPSGDKIALRLIRGDYPLTEGETAMEQTPNYIKSLLMPVAKPLAGRRVWSIDLETVWLPFFTATNTMGDTAIPSDALGYPLRLAYNKDGSVKFSNSGRIVTRVAKPIAQNVTLVRENFVANLRQYAQEVATSKPDDYALQIELGKEAGEPIRTHDKAEQDKAIRLQIERAMAEAESKAESKEAELVTA